MKAILPDFDKKSAKPLYIQLFEYIKNAILAQEIVPEEKLPSIRNLSSTLGVSLTTVETAYEQLVAEGYAESRPGSGYYISEMYYPNANSGDTEPESAFKSEPEDSPLFAYDLSSFDFVKWKKCMAKVLTEQPEELLFEGEPQGEAALREEISRYVFSSRGVRCHSDQVAIAAGTQQITSSLARLLLSIDIRLSVLEDPGYQPVENIFRDRGFAINKVPVARDGIVIEKLPTNVRSVAYVNPSNQFPTGAVMPVGKRYRLLEWAEQNDSYIIEDDYDSELRYFGRPIPAMQGLDKSGRVIYLGSFSSTLFSAIKISYMILPAKIAGLYLETAPEYAQTCSKAEQLTLALFMNKGYYQTGIKKRRRLYAQKLAKALAAFKSDARVTPSGTNSGINIILSVESAKSAEALCEDAASCGIPAMPMSGDGEKKRIIFYYNQIPLDEIPRRLDEMMDLWGDEKMGGKTRRNLI